MKKETIAQLTKDWKGKISIVLVSPETYHEVCSSILSGVVKASHEAQCIFISTNIPYVQAQELLSKSGADPGRAFIIDTISKSTSLEKVRADNVIFLEDPKNLTMMGVAISEAFYKFERKERVLVLDSASSLLTYNEAEVVLRFMHSLIGRMRGNNTSGIILMLAKDYGDVLTRLAVLVDDVVELA
jgi:KaiC/GvpD/RAD55 family RecA-like ATPase